jgi:methylmalonyl-CoA mutase N-terminal domain/subunit
LLLPKNKGVTQIYFQERYHDILKEFMVRNTVYHPHLDENHCLFFEYTKRKCQNSTRFLFPGYHMQEAGATADIELAYTLADSLIEYIHRFVNRNEN